MSKDWEIEVKDAENCTVEFSVTVPDDTVEQARKQAVNEIKQQVEEPGFRKGKTPNSIVENKYASHVSQRLLEKVVPQACSKVYQEHDLKPVADPEISDLDMEDGVHFEAKVDVQPVVEVDEDIYMEIPVEKEDQTVTDEDVQNRIDDYLASKTKMQPIAITRPVQEGDFVRVDMEGFSLEGDVLEGTGEDDVIFEIGSERYLPEIEQGLIGVQAGEEKSIQATFPEDFIDDNLAGETVQFKVKLKEIQEEETATLDDEEVLEELGVESEEEFRSEVRERLEEMSDQNEKQQVSSQIYDHLVENVDFSIPDSLLQSEIDNILANHKNQLESQGMDFEQWLSQQEKSEDDLREEIRPEAEQRIRLTLIFEAIGGKMDIEVEEEDLEEHLAQMAGNYGLEAEEFKKHVPPQMLGSMRKQLRDEKILDYLIESADIKIVEPEEEEQE